MVNPVRSLQMAQAWLFSVANPGRVNALLATVEGDPNGMGDAHAADVRALREGG